MAKVIIGIHGLDNKPSKGLLEDWWKKSMEEGLTAIGKKCKLPEFRLVYWADLFYEKPLSSEIADEKDPFFLDEAYTQSSPNFIARSNKWRKRIVSFVLKCHKKLLLNKDYTLKYNHLADTMLQQNFLELDIYYKEPCNDVNCISCKTRRLIFERAVEILKTFRNHEIFLIGHSMGSIIAYDLMSYEVPEIKIDFFATMGSPLGFPFVLSKIAFRGNLSANENSLLPTPPSIEKAWFNFSDIKDIIAINFKLADEYGENSNGVKPIDFLVTNNYMMRGKRNPHKSFGYLRAREFSQVLAAFIEAEELGLLQKTVQSVKNIIQKTSGVLQNPWGK